MALQIDFAIKYTEIIFLLKVTKVRYILIYTNLITMLGPV
jgi:hypothetical protein